MGQLSHNLNRMDYDLLINGGEMKPKTYKSLAQNYRVIYSNTSQCQTAGYMHDLPILSLNIVKLFFLSPLHCEKNIIELEYPD